MKVDERYFNDFDNQTNDIDSVLIDDERILWRGKPNRKSYISAAIFKMMPIALIWLIFDGFFIGIIVNLMIHGDMELGLLGFIIPFFLIHLAPVWIWIRNIIRSSVELKNLEYAITDRRIIVKSGIIGIDFKSLTFPEIENVNVKVGLIDKMCKVGDIYINASKNSVVLYDLENPYSLGKKLQKIVIDVKADINYPNALRPQNNVGYHTFYTDDPFNRDK